MGSGRQKIHRCVLRSRRCAARTRSPGYLELLRKLTRETGVLLFFDEIQSAFKKSPGGAQQDFGVVPDVCTVGKSLGGGMPLSAFCGRADVMDAFKPVGSVQHSGTFNATLIPVLAGNAFLDEIRRPGFYDRLEQLGARFHAAVDEMIHRLGVNMIVPHHGFRFNFVLGRRTPAQRYEDTFCHDPAVMLKIFRSCWKRGVYFHDYGGSPCHHGFSVQHTEDDIDSVVSILEDTLREHRDTPRAV